MDPGGGVAKEKAITQTACGKGQNSGTYTALNFSCKWDNLIYPTFPPTGLNTTIKSKALTVTGGARRGIEKAIARAT